ncbi:MAG TPA: sialidase family protein [Pyrinomonadaceae bacterium]|jgi:hypothetical protein
MTRQQVNRTTLRALVFVALCACLIGLLGPRATRGANPPSGIITLANTATNPVTYTAGPFLVPNPSGAVALQCTPTLPCDDYFLTVNIPDAYVDTHEVRARFSWTSPGADFDIVVYKNNRIFGQAGSSSMPEYVVLPAKPASYVLRSVPFNPNGSTLNVKIWVAPKAPARAAAQGGAPTFQNFQAPGTMGDAAGEPSIGANWRTGNVLFDAELETFRVTFNDAVTPATAAWVDVSPTTSVTSLDPILFTDHVTGRTIVSQLSGTTSLSSYSDDDGATWTANEGGGLTSGVDHQTVGGGPFAPPLNAGTSAYPHAVYYCSQQLYTAFCAMSPDGGATYGPTVPIYTTECGGIHGHVKVAPDGTVYVPNHNCGENQGVAVSEDNGVTWSVRKVVDNDVTSSLYDSVPSDWDPSVGIASDGTVYFGYKGGGEAHVAVSHDKGKTWVLDTAVAPGLVRNTAFPAVVAGDAERAAFAFLGTDVPGGEPSAVWYLYVATTYDGGHSWFTVNATPNDPVQRGTICSGGLGCAGDRNLLDFIDATVDREGRILVAYADGCITAQCIAGVKPDNSPAPNDGKKKATIARQSGGARLFATPVVVN